MSARFAPGDRVRVRALFPPGHVRTPRYVRGRAGVVHEVAGEFRNPEELAYGRPGEPRRPLYRVRFPLRELWPDDPMSASDTALVDIYEHWLLPAEELGS